MAEQVISGAVLGCIYALVAVGFSLIFAAFALPHFAQGDVLMLGGVVGLLLSIYTSQGLILILLETILIVALAGVLLERLVYRKIVKHSLAAKIICTVNIGVLLQNIVASFWSSRAHAFPADRFSGVHFAAFGREFPPVYFSIFIVTAVLVIALTLLLHKTKLGLGMRATAFSHDLASLMSINVNQTLLATFAIGAALAGAGGILVGQIVLVNFNMGVTIGLKGFVAAVLGGFGSITGALVGGVILGIIENLACVFISSHYKDCIAFVVMLIVLVVRPQGLLGKKREEKI